jgi:hypothetical protein
LSNAIRILTCAGRLGRAAPGLSAALVLAAALAGCQPPAGLPAEQPPPTGRLFPVRVGGAVGLIDARGTLVVEPRFDVAGAWSEGLIAVFQGGKWGYADRTGALVVAPRFADAAAFSGGLAAVVVDETLESAGEDGPLLVLGPGVVSPRRGGYIDPSGELVIAARFRGVTTFAEGRAAAREDGLWGYLDETGAWAIEPRFVSAGPFSEGLAAAAEREGEFGFVDLTGAWAIAPAFPEVYAFSQGLAAARAADGTWGFIRPDGSWAVPPRFFWAGRFADGLAPVKIGALWGYVDAAGAVVVEPRFERAEPFAEGRAAVLVPGGAWDLGQRARRQTGVPAPARWGYIDAAGEPLGEPVWDRADPFHGGLAAVKRGDAWGYVGRDGRVVWEPSS